MLYRSKFATYNLVEPPPKSEKQESIDYSLNDDFLYDTYDTSDKEQEFNSEYLIDNTPFLIPELKKTKKKKKEVILKGPAEFEKAFAKAVEINPSIAKHKNYFVRTAKRESGFNSHILNTTGAEYYGYFQMGKKEIKQTTGMTVELFRNDPVSLILGAYKLYLMNLVNMQKNGSLELGKQQGYSVDAMMAGAWLAGPAGVKRYLTKKGDPSDSHWYKNGGGTSVSKIMSDWMNNRI